MAIPYSCPHCGHQGKAPDQLAGKVVKCKSCQHPFQVPPGADVAAAAEAMPADPADYVTDSAPAPDWGDPTDAQPMDAEAVAEPAYAEPYAEAAYAEPMQADVLPADPMEAIGQDDMGGGGGEAGGQGGAGMFYSLPEDLDPEDESVDADTLADDDDDDDDDDDAPPLGAAGGFVTEGAPLQPELDEANAGALPPLVLPEQGSAAEAEDKAEAANPARQGGLIMGPLGGGTRVMVVGGNKPPMAGRGGPAAGLGAGPGAAAGKPRAGAGAPPGVPPIGGRPAAGAAAAAGVGPAGAGAGRPLGPDQRHCPNCNGVISKKSRLCMHCQFDLNFEHLLTGEKGALNPHDKPLISSATLNAGLNDKRGISVPRLIGAVVVLGTFFSLPWLSGLLDKRDGAPSGFAVQTDLNGMELFERLMNPPVLKPQPAGKGAPPKDAETEPVAATKDKDGKDIPPPPVKVLSNVPTALEAQIKPGDNPGGQVIAIGLAVVPAMSLIVLLYELVRRNTSIVLTILPLFAMGHVYWLLQPGIPVIGMGFWAALGGTVLMQIPGLQKKPK
ncbi:MAG: hypothetical protein AB7K09_24810 [Planctomycetota bacterium]